MSDTLPGYLLILNVLKDRSGAEYDSIRMNEVFTKMGAEVKIKHDPAGRNVREIMTEMKKMDFTNYSYVAVAYMSHGNENDCVQAADKEIIKAQKSILVPLCNIPSLDGKLKWLIMQTCRGSYDFLAQKAEGPVQAIKYPNFYAKFFATSEGMHAWRRADCMGSFFIQALCNRLENEFKDFDIESIMDHVRGDVESETMSRLRIKQCPDYETNYKGKRFFITSGFVEQNY